ELRWPKNAPELPVAGRKIGDADGAAALVGEDRRYDRGIPKILRLEVGHVVQHDVGKSLLLVAGEQAAKERVAVEAGVAHPHQAGGRIDERGRAPVADDRKIQPMIDHDGAKASRREIRSSQPRTSSGASKR